jgi:molybdopterin-binding protein
MVPIADAARALGVSIDTVRRWERAGRLRVERDASNRRVVARTEIARAGGRIPTTTGGLISARNRFEGVVVDIEVAGVVALVEIEAGPHRIVSVVTRDAVEELGLAPGVRAVARVKATSVLLSRD